MCWRPPSAFTSAWQRRRIAEFDRLVCTDGEKVTVRTAAREEGLYTGPGWHADEGGGRVFLRLDPSDVQRMQGLAVNADDPSAARFHHLAAGPGILVRRSSHLVLRDLTFRRAPRLQIGWGAHHLDVVGLRASGGPGMVELLAEDGGHQRGGCRSEPCHVGAPELCPEEAACACVLGDPGNSWYGTCYLRREPPHHVRFRNLDLDGGFPPWTYWTDLKNGIAVSTEGTGCGTASRVVAGGLASPARFEIRDMHDNPGNLDHHTSLLRLRRVEIHGIDDWQQPPYCIEIDGGVFEDGWFGAYVIDGERVRIAGAEFRRMHDDAVLLHDDVARVEVAHNDVRDVLSAFSVAGGEAASDGEVYVHHNVVDVAQDGPPARERIACARPGDGVAPTPWNSYDVDGDGEEDGFCTNLVLGGHGSWGERWQVYANTFAVLPRQRRSGAVARDPADPPLHPPLRRGGRSESVHLPPTVRGRGDGRRSLSPCA